MNQTTPDNRHKHLIVRAEVKKPPRNTTFWGRLFRVAERRVRKWMSRLIADIGMKELAKPRARYCPVVGNRGLTADAIIETSHVCIHTWDECTPAIVQLDLYTCSDLVVEDVLKALDIFEPTKIEYKFLDREHGLVLLEETPEIVKWSEIAGPDRGLVNQQAE